MWKTKCFKWVIIAALHHESMDSHQERISNLRRFEGGYDWSELTFPITLNQTDVFEWKNNVFVNVLGIERGEKKLYILRKANFNGQRMANLLLIDQEGKKHYAAIKNPTPCNIPTELHLVQWGFCLAWMGFLSCGWGFEILALTF